MMIQIIVIEGRARVRPKHADATIANNQVKREKKSRDEMSADIPDLLVAGSDKSGSCAPSESHVCPTESRTVV